MQLLRIGFLPACTVTYRSSPYRSAVFCHHHLPATTAAAAPAFSPPRLARFLFLRFACRSACTTVYLDSAVFYRLYLPTTTCTCAACTARFATVPADLAVFCTATACVYLHALRFLYQNILLRFLLVWSPAFYLFGRLRSFSPLYLVVLVFVLLGLPPHLHRFWITLILLRFYRFSAVFYCCLRSPSGCFWVGYHCGYCRHLPLMVRSADTVSGFWMPAWITAIRSFCHRLRLRSTAVLDYLPFLRSGFTFCCLLPFCSACLLPGFCRLPTTIPAFCRRFTYRLPAEPACFLYTAVHRSAMDCLPFCVRCRCLPAVLVYRPPLVSSPPTCLPATCSCRSLVFCHLLVL